jgi:multiple sugar transport system permease protein
MKQQLGKTYSLQRNRVRLAWILILPALLLRLFTAFYPMLMTFLYSFMDYNLMQGTKSFAGFPNFVRMAGDINFLKSLEFTLSLPAFHLLHIIFGILIALALNMNSRVEVLSSICSYLGYSRDRCRIAASGLFNDSSLINDILFRFLNIRPLRSSRKPARGCGHPDENGRIPVLRDTHSRRASGINERIRSV